MDKLKMILVFPLDLVKYLVGLIWLAFTESAFLAYALFAVSIGLVTTPLVGIATYLGIYAVSHLIYSSNKVRVELFQAQLKAVADVFKAWSEVKSTLDRERDDALNNIAEAIRRRSDEDSSGALIPK